MLKNKMLKINVLNYKKFHTKNPIGEATKKGLF